MTNYPPELIEDYLREFPLPDGYKFDKNSRTVVWHESADDIQALEFIHAYLHQLRGYALNWHRVRELEEALKDLADEADYIMSTNGQGNMRDLYSFVVDAHKLLEKGNG